MTEIKQAGSQVTTEVCTDLGSSQDVTHCLVRLGPACIAGLLLL